METLRLGTFETNSSSCHCMVVASETDFQKFVDGELFADGGCYKCPYQAELITLEDVVNRYNQHVKDEHDYAFEHNYECDEKPISATLAKWVMLHPEVLEIDGDVKMSDYLKDHRDELPDEEYYEATETFYKRVTDFRCWIDDDSTPFSYKMLSFYTQDFSTEYDDYESYSPKDVELADGSKVKELNAVWYY